MSARGLAFVLLVATSAGMGCAAQGTPDDSPGPTHVPAIPGRLEAHLYDAAFVLDHAAEAGLSPAQIAEVRDDLGRTQASWDAIARDLDRESAELAVLLDAAHVDEEAAAREATDVARLETALKETHLRLLVRIKNRLDAEQRSRLDAIRDRASR